MNLVILILSLTILIYSAYLLPKEPFDKPIWAASKIKLGVLIIVGFMLSPVTLVVGSGCIKYSIVELSIFAAAYFVFYKKEIHRIEKNTGDKKTAKMIYKAKRRYM